MSKRIVLRPKANQDLDDHVAYLAKQDNEVALDFFDAVRFTIAQLARIPGMGMRYPVNNSRLKGLRQWAGKGFKKYIIFYIEQDDAIEVIRILYGARSISSILEREV
jgi:toxin ParE1/3/4